MSEILIIAAAILLALGYLARQTLLKFRLRKDKSPCSGCGCGIKKP